MSANIIIYGADWCAFCRTTMEYMDKHNIEYEYRNVEENRGYGEEAVKKSGQFGIPVTDIAGEIIIGFDRPKIDAALREHDLMK